MRIYLLDPVLHVAGGVVPAAQHQLAQRQTRGGRGGGLLRRPRQRPPPLQHGLRPPARLQCQ
eukprot:6290028-Pyramimonas_sp.AAC.1